MEARAKDRSAFDPRIVGLTGKPEQIEAMVKAYRAYSKKVPTNSGGYTMDHTAVVYLLSWDGRFSGTLDRHEQANIQLEKLRRLVDNSQPF